MSLNYLKKFDLNKSKDLLGVDIGTTSIKICLLKNTKEGPTIECIDKKGFDESLLNDGYIIDETLVANELKEMVTRNNVKTKEAACALSSYSVISKKVSMPFLGEEELEKSIGVEVESVIPFPLKDIYYSYYVIGIAEEKQELMDVQVVAAKKEIVDGYMRTFGLAGLNLDLVDVDIFCVTNLVEAIYTEKDVSVVVADIGAAVTNIAIIRGERIEFSRELLVGGQYLTTQIEKSTKLSHREAEVKKLAGDQEIADLYEDFIYNMSSEIAKTINFYTASKPSERIEKVYLTGGTSRLPGLRETIEESTKIGVDFINPFLYVRQEAERMEVYKDFRDFSAVALYLSSRAPEILGS